MVRSIIIIAIYAISSVSECLLSIRSRCQRERKRIVFYSSADFHAAHMWPVIREIKNNNNYDVVLCGLFGTQIDGYKVYKRLRYLPIYLRYDYFFSSEMISPWWIKCEKIYYGHGIGPKLGYQSSNKLKQFDYVFSPCRPIYEAHKHIHPHVFPIGLPLLDEYLKLDTKEIRRRVVREMNLPRGKQLVVYAPSWNSDERVVSDVNRYISNFSHVTSCVFIVSPHPNLLRDGYIDIGQINGNNVTLNSSYETLMLCVAADFVISDISSVLFECIALGVKVVFDGNRKVYKDSGAEKVLTDLLRFVPEASNKKTLVSVLDDYDGFVAKKSSKKIKFVEEYYFNLGNATQSFVRQIDLFSQKR